MIIMAEKILEVRDLKTYFPGRNETVKSVDGVSFDVYKGETFGLVGESGCGKSQTCRSILGLLKKPGQVVGGQIILDGQDITHLKEKELRKLRGRQLERHLLRLARLEADFFKALKLFFRTDFYAGFVTYVKLDDFFSFNGAGVFDCNAYLYPVAVFESRF